MPNNRRSSAALRHGLRGGLFIAALCGLLGLSSHPAALASPMPVSAKPLQIYFVDVEGGQATLFVTPQGKSLLIDTGWPGFNGRDADRIAAVAKLAGITKIDFVLLTHYHQDHAGGVTQLAAKIPVGTFLDHGENREPADSATGQVFRDYQAFLAKENHKRMVVKPGEAAMARCSKSPCPAREARIRLAALPRRVPPIFRKTPARLAFCSRSASCASSTWVI
jgi:hypothetical protein